MFVIKKIYLQKILAIILKSHKFEKYFLESHLQFGGVKQYEMLVSV